MSWRLKEPEYSNYDIYYVEPDWFGPRKLRVNRYHKKRPASVQVFWNKMTETHERYRYNAVIFFCKLLRKKHPITRSWGSRVFLVGDDLVWYVRLQPPLKPRDAYMRQEIRPPLVQILVCCLLGATSLSEPVLVYCFYWIVGSMCQWN